MNRFQRIKEIIFGVLMLLFALLLFLIPEDSYALVAFIIGILLLCYGFRLLWYYFSMARHMVGGQMTLVEAVILLDLALFTFSMTAMESYVIMFYLLGAFAFSGLIDILRAFESKRVGASVWKINLISGIVSIALVLVMLILGVILGKKEFLVYGYALNLIYAGVMRIVSAFRKTAVIYIQ